MTRWARLSGALVVDLVDADEQPQGDWIDVTGTTVGPGWTRSGQDWVAPAVERKITVLAFRNRFTPEEKAALELAAADDPSASQQARAQAATLRSGLNDVLAARYIDLDRADTRQRVQGLESVGLLAAGRAAQILDNPIEAIELP